MNDVWSNINKALHVRIAHQITQIYPNAADLISSSQFEVNQIMFKVTRITPKN